MEQNNNASEITKLLAQIQAEYQAAQSGLTGLAECARHQAITARMENLGQLHESLQALVGDEATRLMGECLDHL